MLAIVLWVKPGRQIDRIPQRGTFQLTMSEHLGVLIVVINRQFCLLQNEHDPNPSFLTSCWWSPSPSQSSQLLFSKTCAWFHSNGLTMGFSGSSCFGFLFSWFSHCPVFLFGLLKWLLSWFLYRPLRMTVLNNRYDPFHYLRTFLKFLKITDTHLNLSKTCTSQARSQHVSHVKFVGHGCLIRSPIIGRSLQMALSLTKSCVEAKCLHFSEDPRFPSRMQVVFWNPERSCPQRRFRKWGFF